MIIEFSMPRYAKPDPTGAYKGNPSRHPLKERWVASKRSPLGRDDRWNDFWAFVSDVGLPPQEEARLTRARFDEPIGPNNFCWHGVRSYKNSPKRGLTCIVEGCEKKSHARGLCYAHQKRFLKTGNVGSAKTDFLTVKDKRCKELMRKYGITFDQYIQMLNDQGDGCAICGGICTAGRRLFVDHCHTTGKVRGLLCNKCNSAIGLLRDNPELIRKAATYCESHAQRDAA